MLTVYLLDSDMCLAGSTQLDEMMPIPARSTLLAPPRTKAPEVARWNSISWEVLPERPAPVLLIPFKVTRSQARSALLLRGLLDQVQPIIDSIEDLTERALAQIKWDDALEFERYSPLVVMIARALDLDDAALDELFIFAASLP